MRRLIDPIHIAVSELGMPSSAINVALADRFRRLAVRIKRVEAEDPAYRAAVSGLVVVDLGGDAKGRMTIRG